MKKISQFLQNFVSFFYPRCCPACHQALQQNEQVVCLSCLFHLPETDHYQYRHNPLDTIFAGRIPVEAIASLFLYRKGNSVQQLLHQLKYKSKKEIGVFFGNYLGKKLDQYGYFKDIDLIIPIPLHPKKEKKRGYNQSALIAEGLSQSLHIPYSTTHLIKEIHTDTQTKKSRISRFDNIKDAFAVAQPEQIAHQSILLCDDVLTTGATLEAAARKLLEVEGVKIYMATLASGL
jgi:ComF family protein